MLQLRERAQYAEREGEAARMELRNMRDAMVKRQQTPDYLDLLRRCARTLKCPTSCSGSAFLTRDQMTEGPLQLLVAKPPIFPHPHSFPAAATRKAAGFPKRTTR